MVLYSAVKMNSILFETPPKIDCCIFPQGLTGKRKNKIFTNTESGFGSLLKWLITLKIEPDQVTAIMEATSVYHENLGYYRKRPLNTPYEFIL